MTKFKLYKKLNINDTAGFCGDVSIYEIINDIFSCKYIAIPSDNSGVDISETDSFGFLTESSILYQILDDFVSDKPEGLSNNPEEAIIRLFTRMYESANDIKSGAITMEDLVK